MTKERVIGKDNTLPWHIPAEFQHFKNATKDSTVIMGRKTYVSLPEKFRPLPGRKNVVISRNFSSADDIDICANIREGIEKAKTYNQPIFIIGGASLYLQSLEQELVDKMHISYVKGDYAGDSYFPNFNKEDWEIEKEEDNSEYTLIVYRRKR